MLRHVHMSSRTHTHTHVTHRAEVKVKISYRVNNPKTDSQSLLVVCISWRGRGDPGLLISAPGGSHVLLEICSCPANSGSLGIR